MEITNTKHPKQLNTEGKKKNSWERKKTLTYAPKMKKLSSLARRKNYLS